MKTEHDDGDRMSRTFEELASDELDALYQGALFLSGGSAQGAERLLVESVTLAFEEHTRDSDIASVERWLEARLVRSFLRHVTEDLPPLPPETAKRLTLDASTFDDLGSQELFDAAAALPPLPRAALWLVLLRRWSYQDTADALGVRLEQVSPLLGYRDVLIQAMVGSRRRARQTGNG